MPFKTGSIREIHRLLLETGYRISEHSIRCWVKQGLVPAAYCGRKAYINYDAVVTVLKNGTPQPQPDTVSAVPGIRAVS